MESGDIPSDTLASVHLLHKQYFNSVSSVGECTPPPLPLVFIHQLYNVLEDRTLVDTELEEARQQGRIRLLKLSSSKDVVIALESDYRDFVLSFCKSSANSKVDEAILQGFHDNVLLKIHTISLDQPKLVKLLGLGKKEGTEAIKQLARAGFLVRSVHTFDEAVYFFGLPAIGEFITNVLSARKAMLALIKRNKYKEILEAKLAEKTTASSSTKPRNKRRKVSKYRNSSSSKAQLILPYGTKFHVDDIIGCGLVRAIKTPSGRLLKLANR